MQRRQIHTPLARIRVIGRLGVIGSGGDEVEGRGDVEAEGGGVGVFVRVGEDGGC